MEREFINAEIVYYVGENSVLFLNNEREENG